METNSSKQHPYWPKAVTAIILSIAICAIAYHLERPSVLFALILVIFIVD